MFGPWSRSVWGLGPLTRSKLQCPIDLAWSWGLAMVKHRVFVLHLPQNKFCFFTRANMKAAPDVLIVTLHRFHDILAIFLVRGGPQWHAPPHCSWGVFAAPSRPPRSHPWASQEQLKNLYINNKNPKCVPDVSDDILNYLYVSIAVWGSNVINSHNSCVVGVSNATQFCRFGPHKAQPRKVPRHVSNSSRLESNI